MAVIPHSRRHQHKYDIRPAILSDLPYLPAVERSAAELFRSDPTLACIADDEPMSAERHRESLGEWDRFGVGLGGTWVVVATPLSNLCIGETGESGEQERREEEEEGVKDGEEGVVGFIVTSLVPILRQRTGTVGGESSIAKDGDSGGKTAEYHERDGAGVRLYFLHVNELSLHVGHQRRGLASGLLNAVKECAEGLVGRDTMAPVPMSGETKLAEEKQEQRGKQSLKVVGMSLTTMRDVPFNAPFYERFGFREIEVEKIGEVVGEESVRIWEGDQQHFAGVGDGTLRKRRCFMVCDV